MDISLPLVSNCTHRDVTMVLRSRIKKAQKSNSILLMFQIQKSQLYFEQKDAFNKALESQKKRVQDLQEKVTKAKALYSKSLRNLEDISESIHARRKLKQLWSHKSSSTRQLGVGAELDYDLVILIAAGTVDTLLLHFFRTLISRIEQ